MPRLFAFISLILILILFAACPTQDIVVTSLSEMDLARLGDLEFRVFKLKYLPSDTRSAENDELTKALNSLLKGNIPNRPYKAKLLGLLALVQYYRQDPKACLATVKEIEKTFPQEQRLFIIKSFFESSPNLKIILLSDGLKNCEDCSFIYLELAELYFYTDDYSQAVRYFDQALLALDARYREFLQNRRDLAFHLSGSKLRLKASSKEILFKNELTTEDILLLLLKETDWLADFLQDENELEFCLSKLKEAGYLFPQNLMLTDLIKRQDIAYLILAIWAHLENNPSLRSRYAPTPSRPESFKSPLIDVPATAYFYTASRLLVEKELMDLPNGRNFFPEKTISGIDFLTILKKLMALYKR